MKIVFLGTAQIAVPALEALLNSRHEVLFVITRPDKPAGRHRHLAAPPLKVAAVELALEVLQPAKAREAIPQIRERGADICAVVAYGGWLPPPVIESTPFGCVNVHPSLLPRWRGAAPVERAIMAGDTETGVSTMLIDEGLDTGPLLLQQKVDIRPTETAGELSSRLAEIGAGLLVETLDALEMGTAQARAQPDDGATYADKLDPAGCRIHWGGPAETVDALVRGANPRPGAWTMLDGHRFKIWRTALLARPPEDATPGAAPHAVPGSITAWNPLVVGCGAGAVELVEVQPEGKMRMSASAFVRGHDLAGAHFT